MILGFQQPLYAASGGSQSATPVSSAAASVEPDVVSARIEARSTGHAVVVSDLGTAETQTLVDPDGSMMVRSYAAPAFSPSSSGAGWTPVDDGVKGSGTAADPYTAPDEPLPISIGGTASSLLNVQTPGGPVTLSLPGLTFSGPVTRTGQTFTIQNVATDTDLRLTVGLDAVQVDFVLRSSSAPTAFTVHVADPDNTIGQLNAEGSGDYVSSKQLDDGVRLGFAAPVAFEGSSGPSPTTAGPATTSGASQTATASGDGFDVTDSLNGSWASEHSYPIVLDPTVVLTGSSAKNCGFSEAGGGSCIATTYAVGSAGSGQVSRELLNFNLGSGGIPDGAVVSSATLSMTSTATVSPARTIAAYEVSQAWAPTPTWVSSGVRNWETNGGTVESPPVSSTAVGVAGTYTWDVTSMVDDWVSGDNNGLLLRDADESTTSSLAFVSSSSTLTGEQPSLSVTYSVSPVPTGSGPALSPAPNGAGYITSQTPTLSVTTADSTGNNVRVDVRVFDMFDGVEGSVVTSGSSGFVTAGSTASWTVPSGFMADGQEYRFNWRVEDTVGATSDWSDYPTSPSHVTVDVTPPAPPSVTSAHYPVGEWSAGGTTFSGVFHDTSSDVSGYQCNLDAGGFSSGACSFTPTSGWHDLQVEAIDNAGNTATTDYPFGVGSGGFLHPTPNELTEHRQMLLAATAPVGVPTSESVTYQYRPIGASSWTMVPTGDVSPSVTWPQAMTQVGSNWNAPMDTWAVSTSITTDGVYQLEACFTNAGTCTVPQNFILDSAGQYEADATQTVGPGSLSLLTGSYVVQATDASIGSGQWGLSMSRTFNSANPTSTQAGYLGPGWTDDLTGLLTNTGGFVSIDNGGGDKSLFTLNSDGTYKAVGDAAVDGLKLTFASSQFTLTDLKGNTTTYAQINSGLGTYTSPAIYAANAFAAPLTPKVGVSYSDGTVPVPGGGTVPKGWPTQQLLEADPGQSCAGGLTPNSCRALIDVYGDVTTSSGTVVRLTGLSLSQNASGSGSPTLTPLAAYAYNSSGQLISVTDPRDSLSTSYTYDTHGRIATITPPGLAAWILGYDSSGRLTSVSRSHSATYGGGTATTDIVYGVPLSGSGLPDLTAATTADWLQTDNPTDATAVFPPGHDPANPASPTSSEWPWASLTYTDADGRTVNTAAYGGTADPDTGAAVTPEWEISTTEYSPDGLSDAIRTLTPDNRNRALSADPTGSTTLADTLDTENTYSADGIDLLSTYGPSHAMTEANGTVVAGRVHTANAYDNGNQDTNEHAVSNGLPMHLLLTSTTGLSVGTTIPGSSEVEDRTTHNNYDVGGSGPGWTLRAPIQTIDGAGDITATGYTSDYGLTASTTQPDQYTCTPGNTFCTAGYETDTYYYDIDTGPGGSGCGSTPKWVGLPCKIVSGSNDVPPEAITNYNIYDEPTTVTKTPSGLPLASTTTTTTYDSAARQTGVSMTGLNAGTAVPAVTTAYSPTTGLVTTTSSTAGTITRSYDDWGQQISYTDATSDTTTTGYDLQGRPTTVAGTHGTSTSTYDQNGDDRGMPTTISDTGLTAGTFTGSYDADGNLISEVEPGGLTATWHYDAAGETTHLDYTKTSTTWMSFDDAYNAAGEAITTSGPISHQLNSYDKAGRLTKVQDTLLSGPGTLGCTTRSYGYDLDSNRTGMLSTAPGSGGSCGTPGTIPTNRSYDAGDRITNSGYTYDRFGRITAVPAADMADGVSTSLTYYYNDMVNTEAQGGHTLTWGLDPNGRLNTKLDSSTTHTATNHYGDDSDSPSWTNNGDGTWSRNISDLSGSLGAIQNSTGTPQLELTNLHGDLVATTDATTAATSTNSYSESTEFGVPRSGTTSQRYAWLGAKRRASDTLGALVLMGERVYDPATGRFLQIDPVPGGSANNYDYCVQDPIDNVDLGGTDVVSLNDGPSWGKWHRQTRAFTVNTTDSKAAGAIDIGSELREDVVALLKGEGVGLIGMNTDIRVRQEDFVRYSTDGHHVETETHTELEERSGFCVCMFGHGVDLEPERWKSVKSDRKYHVSQY